MAQMSPEYKAAWYQANKHTRNHKTSEWKKANHQARVYQNAQKRAKERSIPFDIVVDDVVVPVMCPVLKKPMEYGTRYAHSLDRIEADRGYTKGNIQVMSTLANRMKSDASVEDLRNFALWVLQTYPICQNESTHSLMKA